MNQEAGYHIRMALRLLEEAIGLAEAAQWSKTDTERIDWLVQAIHKMRMTHVNLINAQQSIGGE